jgi:hypothetical protein
VHGWQSNACDARSGPRTHCHGDKSAVNSTGDMTLGEVLNVFYRVILVPLSLAVWICLLYGAPVVVQTWLRHSQAMNPGLQGCLRLSGDRAT